MKKINKLFILVVISILLLSSCATLFGPSQKEVHDSWLGSTKVNLIQSWGPPTRITSDGQGGEVLTYEKSKTGRVYYGTYIQNTDIYYSDIYYSDMFVDKSGKIYFYRYGVYSGATQTGYTFRFIPPYSHPGRKLTPIHNRRR